MSNDDIELIEQLEEFGRALYHESRFFSNPTDELYKALVESISSLKETQKPDLWKSFFRARIHSPRMMRPSGPYDEANMWNPPGTLASPGRLNPRGISRLYLASTDRVALLEVRSVTGDYVTVTRFGLNRNIEIFDFRKLNFVKDMKYEGLLRRIYRIISAPVYEHDNESCILAQWLIEYMKTQSVRAVIYPSVLRGVDEEKLTDVDKIFKVEPKKNFNICSFYPSDFSLFSDSISLKKITSMNIDSINFKEIEKYR